MKVENQNIYLMWTAMNTCMHKLWILYVAYIC